MLCWQACTAKVTDGVLHRFPDNSCQQAATGAGQYSPHRSRGLDGLPRADQLLTEGIPCRSLVSQSGPGICIPLGAAPSEYISRALKPGQGRPLRHEGPAAPWTEMQQLRIQHLTCRVAALRLLFSHTGGAGSVLERKASADWHLHVAFISSLADKLKGYHCWPAFSSPATVHISSCIDKRDGVQCSCRL